MFQLIQKVLIKFKVSLFPAIFMYWVVVAVLCSAIYTLLLSFVMDIVFFEYIWAALFIACFILLTTILKLWYFVIFHELSYWKSDERKKEFSGDTVVLTYSEAVEKRRFWGISNFVLIFTNFGKGPRLHRFYYKSILSGSSEQKYFYCIVDEDMLQYFTS